MIIKFERRTDQPDAAGRCKVYLVATFDRQRLRLSTGERCLVSEWNEEKSRFRKSFSGFQEANDVLDALGEKVVKAHRDLRTAGVVATSVLLKDALAPKVATADLPPAPLLTDLFGASLFRVCSRGGFCVAKAR